MSVRARLYLTDFDEDIWVNLPARVNEKDSFYIDQFIREVEQKKFNPEIFDDLTTGDYSILYCVSTIWGHDEKGVFQQVYLAKEYSGDLIVQ